MNQAANPIPVRPMLPAGGLESGVEIGDFRIERRLGAGGMGIVYQARQISLNRPVALKVLGRSLFRQPEIARFQREAQAAARLKHPAIAQVFFIGQDNHVCYLAMELIEGTSLRKVLDRLGTTAVADSSLDSVVRDDLAQEDAEAQPVRFDVPTEATNETKPPSSPPEEINPYLSPQARELRTTQQYIRRVCELVREAADALAHAHQQGVIHRDIKPDNLLLDRQGKVHLIDFGVARFFEDQAVTYTGQLVGTPLYMSPEQVNGRLKIDVRTDIYSLGLVLYELLTLRPPIEATNRESLLRTIVTKPLAPVSWRNGSIKSDLERIVHKATQKDPDQRYQSATDFAADLDRFLAAKPVEAPAYHFRLDEREITAARPGGVVLAAFIFFVVSLAVSLFTEASALMMGLMIMNSVGLGVFAMQTLLAVLILAVGLAVGYGILDARKWARWTGIVLSGLFTVFTFVAVIGLIFGIVTVAVADASSFEFLKVPPEETTVQNPDGTTTHTMEMFDPRNFIVAMAAFYGLPLVVAFILWGTALWNLLAKSTAAWFSSAAELRAEHHRVRQELSI